MGQISTRMYKVKYIMLFAVTFMLALHYSTSVSYACSCAELNSVQIELERSSTVFTGKAIEIVDNNEKSMIQSSMDSLFIRFQVKEFWKGVSQAEVMVHTVRESASCGYNFTLNQEYLVYAQGDDQLDVSLCSRTTPLASAEEDLKELGEGHKSKEQISIDEDAREQDAPEHSVNDIQLFSGLLFVGLVVAVVVYIVKRR